MRAIDLLNEIDVGASVAEFDTDLESYFIETNTFKSVIEDRADVIAGDKGTGKTAIYRVLKKNYRAYPEMEAIEIVDAFNLQGNPIFQKLLSGPSFTEGQYRTIWKSYIFSLVGNWILSVYPANFNEKLTSLRNTLDYLGLTSADVSPATIFGNLYSLVVKLSDPRAVQTEFSITETGMPVVIPRVEFGPERSVGSEIYNDEFLKVLGDAVESTELSVWVLFDRLDEAFAGSPDVEIPALRALMRTYLDLTDIPSVKLKLFVRRDLFRRIIRGGFVNLTHINARRIDIVWDEDDLVSLVCRRLKKNDAFHKLVGEGISDDDLLRILLPDQIDTGDRKPTSKAWIMSRIRDGSNSRPPRNIIDLLNKAKDAQARREGREAREIEPNVGPIILADSVKVAFSQLSAMRVEDTLLAEATEQVAAIEIFRDGKAEHNVESLQTIFNGRFDVQATIRALVDIGFLEEFGSNYKIPMLYRDGLKITQGKGF